MTAASRYSVIVEWSDEDAVYIATAPELPGCRTHGATRIEAIEKCEEAIAGWLDTMAALGRTMPMPRLFNGWSTIPGVASVAARDRQEVVAS